MNVACGIFISMKQAVLVTKRLPSWKLWKWTMRRLTMECRPSNCVNAYAASRE